MTITIIMAAWCWVHCTMFRPTLCLSSLNELVEKLVRSQQSKLNLLEQLVPKRRIGFIFSSIIMYKSPATFMKGCRKFKSHKWICDVKLVRNVGRKREKKEARGQSHSAKGELKKRSKVKISWLAFIVTWCEECEREKRRKRWRNK